MEEVKKLDRVLSEVGRARQENEYFGKLLDEGVDALFDLPVDQCAEACIIHGAVSGKRCDECHAGSGKNRLLHSMISFHKMILC